LTSLPSALDENRFRRKSSSTKIDFDENRARRKSISTNVKLGGTSTSLGSASLRDTRPSWATTSPRSSRSECRCRRLPPDCRPSQTRRRKSSSTKIDFDENRARRKSISTKIELDENRFRRTSSWVGPQPRWGRLHSETPDRVGRPLHLAQVGVSAAAVDCRPTADRLRPVDENRARRKSISTKIELDENRFRRTSSWVGPRPRWGRLHSETPDRVGRPLHLARVSAAAVDCCPTAARPRSECHCRSRSECHCRSRSECHCRPRSECHCRPPSPPARRPFTPPSPPARRPFTPPSPPARRPFTPRSECHCRPASWSGWWLPGGPPLPPSCRTE
jgi:hypothetical protein